MAEQVRFAAGGVQCHEALLDLSPLLRLGNFDFAEADLAADQGGYEALMFPGPSGELRIRVDPRPRRAHSGATTELSEQTRRHRLRFRIAHEIAHSFFYERTPLSARRRRRATPAEESFCDRFASALLVPPAAIRRAPPIAQSIVEVHSHFDVSIEAAARAFANVFSDLDIAVAYWEPQDGLDGQGVLAVQWVSEGLLAEAEDVCVAAAGLPCSRAWSRMTLAETERYRRQLVAVGRWRAET